MKRTRSKRRHLSAQALVEFSLVFPIFVVVVLGCVDAGRYIYIRGQISANATAAARLLTLPDNQTSDCTALNAAEQSAGLFSLSQDVKSVVGDTAVNGNAIAGTVPPPGTGYIYIYPATATTTSVCSGTSRGSGQIQVQVQIVYSFKPLTPVASGLSGLYIIDTAAEVTQY